MKDHEVRNPLLSSIPAGMFIGGGGDAGGTGGGGCGYGGNVAGQPRSPKMRLHGEICDELNVTYEAKNHDYNDSFAQLRKRRGSSAILIRLFDKYLRLEALLDGKPALVKDESIEDTLRDMANYCIMELVERSLEKDGI